MAYRVIKDKVKNTVLISFYWLKVVIWIPAQAIEVKQMTQGGYQFFLIIIIIRTYIYELPAHLTRDASHENVTKMPPGMELFFFSSLVCLLCVKEENTAEFLDRLLIIFIK